MALDYSYPRAYVTLTTLDEDWGAGTATDHTFGVDPREVEIERNDSRTADTCKVTLDMRDFPMDPRTVRSCAVTVFLANVATPTALPTDDDGAFFGFLDAPESTRNEYGASVALECRDCTGLFIDHQWSGGMIDVSKPLGDVIAGILAEVPGADGIRVGFSDGANNAIVAQSIGRSKFAPQKDDSAWTVLTEICGKVGLIPVFELNLLLILDPSDFGVSRQTFLATDELEPTREAFTYGVDLADLTIRRSFREARQTQIEIRCWDPVARKATTARYPTAPVTTRKRVGADNKITTYAAPILPYYVTGTYTGPDLAALAERIYTQAAREEIEITASTRRMVPQLGNGARVTITISPDLTTDIAGLSPGEAIAALTTGPRALAADVAQAFVGGAQMANNLAVEFYARSVKHRWSREDGYTCEMTLINLLGGDA